MTKLKCELSDVTPLVTWMVFKPAIILVFECQGLEEVESRPAGRPAVRKSRRLLWLSYGTDRPNVFTVF